MTSSTRTSPAGLPPPPTGRRLTVLVIAAIVVLAVAGFAAFHHPDPPDPPDRPVHEDPKPDRELAHQAAPAPTLPSQVQQPALPQEPPPEPLPTSGGRPANVGAPGMARKLAQITRAKVEKYVHEAYPAWLKAHPGEMCPHQLSELNELMGESNANDGWGKPLKMYCGAVLGSSGKRIEVISYGRDGERGTEDDIRAEE